MFGVVIDRAARVLRRLDCSLYGAVVYARSICTHGVKVSLWAAKSCVVPSKEQKVSRLELLAAVLLSKLIVSTKPAVERVKGHKYILLV